MKIIISPAKKMRVDNDAIVPWSQPAFLEQAGEIMHWMQKMDYTAAKTLWGCSDKIAQLCYDQLMHMDLLRTQELTPAVLAYDGIAYQYMAPAVFEDHQFNYVQEHLYILSGLYGVLRAMDGIVPYRLEMNNKAKVAGTRSLYEYWGDLIYKRVIDGSHLVINLASKEYSICVEKYLIEEDRMITCIFGELSDHKPEKIVQKGVYAKMARGDMVRYMAENQIEDPGMLKEYDRMGYLFNEDRSTDRQYIFLKTKD